MKPEKLIISGFGPYAGQVEIPFAPFDGKGLFLISGDTGAGKTTIFDAICYALFGENSGSYRDTKNLRSEYAADDTKTFVDFYFSHQGKHFHVLREPAYLRKARRGDKLVPNKEDAIFYEEGQPPVEGIKAVSSAIESLLGVNDRQFKQIAMIAQGEFWELLNAKTEKRTEILRTIFHTGGYHQLTDVLKTRMDQAAEDRKETGNRVVQYLGDVRAEEDCPEAAELEAAKQHAEMSKGTWESERILQVIDAVIAFDEAGRVPAEEEKNGCEQALAVCTKTLHEAEQQNAAVQRRNALRDRQKALDAERPAMEERKKLLIRKQEATRKLQPLVQQVREAQKRQENVQLRQKETEEKLAETEGMCRQAEAADADAQLHKTECEQLRTQADQIEKERPKYDERDALKDALIKIRKEQAELSAKEAEKSALKNQITARIAALQAETEKNRNLPQELEAAKGRESSHLTLYREIRTLYQDGTAECVKLSKAYQAAAKEYASANEAFVKAKTASDRADQIFHDERAGILALSLREGEKCPVCGSVHHPEPAHLSSDSVSEDEVRHLKEQAEALRTEREKAVTAAEHAKTAYFTAENSYCTRIHELLNRSELQADLPEANAKELFSHLHKIGQSFYESLQKLSENRQALENACSLYRKSEEDLSELRDKKLAALISEIQEISDRRHACEKQQASAEAALSALTVLNFSSWKEAEAQVTAYRKQISALETRMQSAQKKREQAQKEYARLASSLNELKNQVKQEEENCRDKTERMREEGVRQGFENSNEAKVFFVSEAELQNEEAALRSYDSRVDQNIGALRQLEEETKGKELIALEEIREQETQLRKNAETAREHVSEIKQRIRSNGEIREKIATLMPKLKSAMKQAELYQRLYQLVRGTTGEMKITFEQYVQSAGFDRILRAANRRLQPMSGYQYELFRKQEVKGGKSNTYLDLEVLDHYTGKRRPVSNLSGGESFLASLSLALGLSDTVSMNLGGVQMDALFIDEGFGTLDKKSIENALEILLHISDANKLVGVISHREELVENIPQQIQVRKDQTGSHIEIITGD